MHQQDDIKLLRMHDVLKVTGLSRSTINRKRQIGEFPQPVRLGENSIAWKSTDVSDWINSLPTNAA